MHSMKSFLFASLILTSFITQSVAQDTLTLALTGMTPHLTQLFEMRVVDWANGREVGRARVASILSADFNVSVPGIFIGGSYNIDFYADLSGNRLYDAPGTDHAWRMTVENVTGDTTLAFAHNTTFTDIEWNYLMTLDIASLSPHLGNKFEARLVDEIGKKEIGRVTLSAVDTADFSVSIPGLEIGRSYLVDFYADFNNNNLYDSPGTDHAWRINLVSATGDTTLTFSHNTNFTDVDWPYLLTLNLGDFSPHVGQLFEARLVDRSDGHESVRTQVVNILTADFSVSLPGMRKGNNYAVDFYADFSGNGLYDAPGSDHAWRINLDDVTGDTAINYNHFAVFTDIEWPYNLELDLIGMSPHIGNKFEARVYETSTGDEISRVLIDAIDATDFSVNLPGIQASGNYTIDFYADISGNGLYDAPSTDHAWRMELANSMGDTTLYFTHNTTFTDIDWPYLLEMAFFDMSPHVGQLFELRIIDLADSTEAIRMTLDAVDVPDYLISFPVLTLGSSYNVDFYADLNGNGAYDIPGEGDHSWRMSLDTVPGDTVLIFSHNTTFTDIMWDHLQMIFTGMSPHVGQLFELRIVDTADSNEVGLFQLDTVVMAEYSVSIPGLTIGGSYNIDFYADFNQNGQYDAPGIDHAWRIMYDYSGGYTGILFSHNTTFTDLEWPYGPLNVATELALPDAFYLAQNYPNPFNPISTIRFELPRASDVSLIIYDLIGREVVRLLDGTVEAGSHTRVWDARNRYGRVMPSGIFFARLVTKEYTHSIKMVLLK